MDVESLILIPLSLLVYALDPFQIELYDHFLRFDTLLAIKGLKRVEFWVGICMKITKRRSTGCLTLLDSRHPAEIAYVLSSFMTLQLKPQSQDSQFTNYFV